MAKSKISEWSSTSAGANLNTDVANINIDEGCSPANINNAIRAVMAQVKDLQSGASGDTIPVTAGGTGATTASSARTALGAASSGANSDITSLSGLTTTLSTSQGGTGSNATTYCSLSTNVTGTLPVANGGTGGANATTARSNLGLGTAAVLDVGTTASKVVQLDSNAKLPAVDGSQLTGITIAGMTLLGTLTPSAVTNATLSGLTLTSYKKLYVVVKGLSSTATASFRLGTSGSNDTRFHTTDSYTAATTIHGFVEIDLYSGWGITYINSDKSTYGDLPSASSVAGTFGYLGLPISNSSTSIYLSASAGNFDAGSVEFYGVK